METQAVTVYAFGPFRLDPAERRLLLEDEPLALPPEVLDTLIALVEADGRLVTKDALMQRLWPDTVVEEVNLARNVSLLRKALGEKDGRTYIETVPKSGYRFTAPLTRVAPASGLAPSPTTGTDGPDSSADVLPRRPSSRVSRGLLAIAVSLACLSVWLAAVARRHGSESAVSKSDYVRVTFDGDVLESVVSPDGTMVASVLRGPPMRLVLRDVRTAAAIDRLQGHWMFRPKWSRDGSMVAVLWRPELDRAGYLAVVPRLGGPPGKLLPTGFGVWSPDGKRFASVRGNTEVGIFGLDGVLLNRVPVGGFRWMMDFDWSRVSDRLLLWTEDDERHTILWSVSPDGSDVSRFYASPTRLLGAVWTLDGSGVYVLRPAGETADLVRVPVSAPTDDQVLIRGLTAGKGLSLSADGSKLLFRRVTSVANLWRVAVGPGEPMPAVPVALTRGASRMLSPELSPDGQSIAFVRAEANETVIQTSALPLGGPPESLTSAGLNVTSLAWSPDGSRIAFAAARPPGSGVWIVAVDDRSPRRLPTGHTVSQYPDSLAWVRDGRVAYQTADHRHYYLLDPATGKEERLGSGTGNMFTPRFSADGALAAVYWNRRESGPALWTIDLKTGTETFVAKGIRPIGWSPGNGAIYGIRAVGDESEIVRVDRWTGAQTVVTRFPSGLVVTGAVSRDGRQIVCSVRDEIADAWTIENFDPQHVRSIVAR